MNFKTILPSKRGKVWRNSALLLLAMVGVPMLSFLPVDSKITGRVFRDFNANGVFDTTPIEIGVAGVTVTAYTPTGSSVTATTGSDGTYSLTTVTGTKYRIEFTGLETGDFESAYGSAAGNNGTSVQFAASGDVNVNLGVNYPAQYSSTTNPKVITSGFINGDQDGTEYDVNILWGVPFNSTDTPTKTNLGTASQYGSVWGTAYAKTSKKFYVAAFTKRNVGFGPSGPGAIYVTQTSGDIAAATPTVFYDFPDSEVGGAANVIHGTLGDAPGNASTDNAGFDNVGKTSLGDIEVSEDEKDLYVINLADRTLNKINIATKTKTTISIPTPGAGTYSASYRPFALKAYRGKIYVGVVMTNETSYGSSTYSSGNTYANDKGVTTGMNAAVLEYDGSAFTKVLDFPLTYTKQPSDADQTGVEKAALWRPWTSTFRTDRDSPASYPQAWLTNIEFDVTGEMILGIRDRFGDQMGYNNYRPSTPVGPGTNTTYSAIAPGEILRAGKSGNAWTIEAAGVVNGVAATTSQKSQVGPGGAGKFYWGDVVGAGLNHGSSSLGGLALLAGSGKVIMTAMDPNDVFNTGGIKRLINAATVTNSNGVLATAGSPDDNTTNSAGSAGSTDGKKKGAIMYSDGVITWGKANGMGDVELLTAPAPIEIGNRVWIDKDADGIQDGDETGLAGVSIQLLAVDGTTVLATAVTDANGNYIFSNATGTSTTSLIYGLTTLTANTSYTLRILNVSGSSKATALQGYSLTGADKDATTNGDTRDSDGIVSTVNATAAVTTGNNGENNHTFDFGFVQAVNLGNKVWIDANNNGIFDTGELPVIGATVKLYAASSTDGIPATPGTPLATATTTSDGYYLFDNLAPGDYVVSVMDPTGYVSSTVNAGDPDTDQDDNDDNGVRTSAGETFSNTVTLTVGGEPTGETPNTNPANNIADNSSNLTVDFGYIPNLVNLGNKVWIDANNNGIFDSGELPVIGATVKLYTASANDGIPATPGTPVTTVTTDANGYYLFNNLAPGDYVVSVMNPAGYTSSTVNAGDPDIDQDDNDDNGVRTSAGETFSNTVTLTVGGEPTGETPSNNTGGIPDNSSNLTVDFGFVQAVNLGNKVWYDANDNGLFDTGELPVIGATVKLYAASANDGIPAGTAIATATTTSDGYYLFDNLVPGNYIVSVTDPTGYVSSTVNAGDPDTDQDDNDDNGVRTASGETFSNTITLAVGTEPTGETPNTNPAGNIADNSSNLTLDFGYVANLVNLGNKVWNDLDKNGLINGSEVGIPDVTVNLYANNNGTPGALITTVKTDANGLYLFPNLTPGTYIVGVVNPTGFTSSPVNGGDPDTDLDDNDDNGITTTDGITYSDPVTLEVGGEPTGENPSNNTGSIPDNSSNLTVDFGFYNAALPVKLINFEGKAVEEKSVLDWSTSAETNSAYFEVQRSVDGKTWTTVGSVLAQGESSDVYKYDFTDGNPVNGENLYRLKMVDLDQTYAYSRIISIKLEVGYKLSVFPNPTSDVVKIETSTGATVQKVQVYSLIGKLVKEVVSPKGGEISVQQLPTGMYMLRITTSNGTVETRKVVVVR